MKELKELVYILNTNKIKIFDGNRKAKEEYKMASFFDALSSGKVRDDQEAFHALYPDNKDDGAYRKMKSQFRDRLFDGLLHFNGEQAHFTDYQQAYYACNRSLMYVKILSGQNAHNAALFLANKVLRKADKYEFTLLSIDLLSYLMLQYGSNSNGPKELCEVMSTLEQKRAVFNAECKAEQVYVQLTSGVNSQRLSKEEACYQSTEAYTSMLADMEWCDSYKLHLYGTVIGLMQYSVVNDYTKMLNFCRKKLAFFQKKPFHARAALQLCNYHELLCHIQFRHFDAGRVTAEKCFELAEEGTFNWFKYRELYLQLCFYSHQYVEAANTIKSTMKHPRFQFLPDATKESWMLFEYYAHYVQVLSGASLDSKTNFRYSKVKNELDGMTRDKSGMNAAILILKLLFLFTERKGAVIIEESEALEQYCYRNLNKKDTERSSVFIRMLLRLPLWIQNSKEEDKKLKKLTEQFFMLNQVENFHVEIIPYEHLWEYLLKY
jgi:hypothetical protein